MIGQHIIRLSEIDSTNNYASELSKTDKWSEGTAIIAEFQTGGRGQRGTVWQSLRGQNLTMSIILTPDIHCITGAFALNKAVAVALRNALARFVAGPVWIKWPNDILTTDGKLAGILIENLMNADRIERCIAGIGININQTDFNLLRATSLKLLTGYQHSIDEVFGEVCCSMEAVYSRLKAGETESIEDEYNWNLFGLGSFRTFSDNVEEFEAEVLGTDDFGRLKLKDMTGSIRIYDVKSVVWESDLKT